MANSDISLTQSFDPRIIALQRQQKLADMLSQQSQEPTQVFTGGGQPAPVSWLSGLSKGLAGFGSGYLDQKVQKSAEDYGNSQLADALRAKYAAANMDPGSVAASQPIAAPASPGLFDRAANWLGMGDNGASPAPSTQGPQQASPQSAPPVAPPQAAQMDPEGNPASSLMGSTQGAASAPVAAPMAPQAAVPDATATSPYLAKLAHQAQLYSSYQPTTMQGKMEQQQGLLAVQQAAQEFQQNLPRYNAILAAAPDAAKPIVQAAINTGDMATLQKYEGELAGKLTPQAQGLNPEAQMKYDAEKAWIAGAPGRTPAQYDAMGEAEKEKATMPFKIALARDKAAASLDAQQKLIAGNPDAISLGADYFIANGGKYPPNARSAGMQMAIASAAKQRMNASGVSMDDLVSKGIGIHARQGAATGMAKTQAQTAVNEGTVNNSINIVRNLLPTAASKGTFTDINQLGQDLARRTNDPNAVLLKNGIDSISNEYARVMTGSTSGSPSSDAARKEAGNRILYGYNSGTIDKVMNQMQQEMAGRSQSQAGVMGNLTGGNYRGANVPFSPAPQAPATSNGWSNFKVHP